MRCMFILVQLGWLAAAMFFWSHGIYENVVACAFGWLLSLYTPKRPLGYGSVVRHPFDDEVANAKKAFRNKLATNNMNIFKVIAHTNQKDLDDSVVTKYNCQIVEKGATFFVVRATGEDVLSVMVDANFSNIYEFV